MESGSETDDHALLESMRGGPGRSYELTRFVFLRALGFVYCIAFLVLQQQHAPLIGSRGLLPARRYVAHLHRYDAFWQHPSLFYFDASDRALGVGGLLGLALAVAVLFGVDNALVLAVLWALYQSYVQVGQIFYGYGWETLLLEAGFLAIFFGPVSRLRDRHPAGPVVPWLLRWLLFRVMFGAGLIKLRGDPCWRDLTCLIYHYETQPVPHVLSWLLHQAPPWFHRAGTLFNHVVELLVPWFLLVHKPWLRHWAAALTILFQVILILSGNLSFLNWLTIAVAVGCIDDGVWSRLLPRTLARAGPLPRSRIWAHAALGCVVGVLSISPIVNMLSPHQRMNTSFEPLHLVNSYGAFGSIGRERDEVILQGTSDGENWVEYEFKCKPGAISRRPCWITPYHYRIDWQMWFAALSDYETEPWLVHMIFKLLHNDRGILGLLANDPFPRHPPRLIRAERYRYHFTRFGSRDYWHRERIGEYLPPLAADDPRLLEFLGSYGFTL